MNDEIMSEGALRQKRAGLLFEIGEEAHQLIRNKKLSVPPELKKLSEEIQKVDIDMVHLVKVESKDTCPQCHAKVISGAAFCANCGFSVKEYFDQYAGVCNCCGANITSTQTFCTTCGTLLIKENE